MKNYRSSEPNDLRVIFCMIFDHRAAAADVAEFKRKLIECPNVLQSVELTGAFDFMLEAALPNFAAYQEKMTALAEPLVQLVRRYESNFVCRRYIRDHREDHAVWLPCSHGMSRIDFSTIEKVTAEGDYMRIHSGGGSWLVHATMRSLRERLDPRQFVQIHRSILLRSDLIDRFVHADRRWTVRLIDGSTYTVAKSHLDDVITALQIESSKDKRGSAKRNQLSELTSEIRRIEAEALH